MKKTNNNSSFYQIFSKLFVLFLLLGLFSCGTKKKNKTVTSIKLGGLVSLGSPLISGGMMLYFQKLDGAGVNFAEKFTGQEFDLENGQWDISAIAWEGTALEESSTLRCAMSGAVTLAGGEQNITLNFLTTNCLDNRFGDRTDRDGITGAPHTLNIRSCANSKCLNEGQEIRGIARSFKVIFPSTNRDGIFNENTGISSSCQVDIEVYPNIELSLRVPILNLGAPVVVKAYDDDSCSAGFDHYIFPTGFKSTTPELTTWKQGEFRLGLKSNLCRTTTNRGGGNYRYSASGNHIICTPAQFQAIATAINAGTEVLDTFLLGANLDFTGITYSDRIGDDIAKPFKGKFLGNGFSINNLTASFTDMNSLGIFGFIAGAEISELHLYNIDITATNIYANKVGALVGEAVDYGGAQSRIKRISGENITIRVESCSGACTNIGGLIGKSVNSEAWDINLLNVSIITDQNASSVGGIIGYMSNSASLRHSSVDNVTFKHSTISSTPNSFGGAVGTNNGEVWGVSTNIIIDKDVDPFNITSSLGGVIGRMDHASARAYYVKSTGVIDVEDISKVGGIIGSVTNSSNIEDLINNTQITVIDTGDVGETDVGGVIGRVDSTGTAVNFNLKRLRNYGEILGCVTGCGGIIGFLKDDAFSPVTLDNAHSYSNISGANDDVGGVVGKYDSSNDLTIIQFSHSEGTVSGNDNVGGIIGVRTVAADNNGQVKYVYSLGNLTVNAASTPNLGGIIGNAGLVHDGVISEVYSHGTFTNTGGGASTNISGLFGSNTDGGTIATTGATKCFTVYTHNIGICTLINPAIAVLGDYTGFDSVDWGTLEGESNPVIKNYIPFMILGDVVTGSERDPYLISTIAQWNSIGDNPALMDKAFILGNDLDFSGEIFKPIASVSNGFSGIFMGNDFTIRNITFDDSGSAEPLGVFRKLGGGSGNGPRIQHRQEESADKALYLENINFTGDNAVGVYVGILAGLVEDNGTEESQSIKIRNVHVIEGSLSAGGATGSMGGVIGKVLYQNTKTEIKNISSSVSIDTCGGVNIGGIIGEAYDSSEGSLTTDAVILFNMKFSGSIDCSTSTKVAGIIGYVDNASTLIESSVNTGTITGGDNTGGIVGSTAGSVRLCINRGNITGKDYAAGIGSFSTGKIVASYSTGSVTATISNAAALAYCSEYCTIEASFTDMTSVTGSPKNSFLLAATTFYITDSFYTGSTDESILGTSYFTQEQFNQFDNTKVLIDAMLMGGVENPWVILPGNTPQLNFEVFPEILEHH